jgi:hypothetical protein
MLIWEVVLTVNTLSILMSWEFKHMTLLITRLSKEEVWWTI